MTVGPWRPVSVQAYTTRITDLRALPVVTDDHVELEVKLELSDPLPGAKASVTLKGPDNEVVIGQNGVDVSTGKGTASFKFSKGVLELWYPVGYGKQPLYNVEVNITGSVSTKYT